MQRSGACTRFYEGFGAELLRKQQNYQNPSCQVSGNHATIDIATRLAERSLLQWRLPTGSVEY